MTMGEIATTGPIRCEKCRVFMSYDEYIDHFCAEDWFIDKNGNLDGKVHPDNPTTSKEK